MTPLRAGVDAMLNMDLGPGGTLAWPTAMGWMMSSWAIYASLLNGATLALYHVRRSLLLPLRRLLRRPLLAASRRCFACGAVCSWIVGVG